MMVLLIMLTLALHVMPLAAARQPAYISRWQQLPSRTLINKAQAYTVDRFHPDSALACYTLVSNRYTPLPQ